MAFILAICSFVMPSQAKVPDTNPAHTNMQILLIAEASIGSAAIAEFVRTHDARIVIVSGDGDMMLAERPFAPFIANKDGILPMATVKPDRLITDLKTDAPKSVGNKPEKTFYDLPPNDYGFSGMTFANPIRAQPS